jgi:DNA mismatch endonuclease (patch repair protein)
MESLVQGLECKVQDSACCRIPKTNREFWVKKIRRNKERDMEEQKKLAAMGWHCMTIWECELKPPIREQTLNSIAFTLNHIWLQDHRAVNMTYPHMEEESTQTCMAAKNIEKRR